MRGFRFLAAVALLVLPIAGPAAEDTAPANPIPERVLWQGEPIPVTLAVGHERQVKLPSPLQQVAGPESLKPHLRVQYLEGTDSLFLLAQTSFEPARLVIRGADGSHYLLDVSATDSAPGAPVQVFASNPIQAGDDGQAGDPGTAGQGPRQDYIPLTRFALQQLYAPQRLLRNPPGIERTPLETGPVDLAFGGALVTEPLVAWTNGHLYVTAVRLTNRTGRAVNVDPRAFRGRWLTRTLTHGRVLPAGDAWGRDSTVLVLVSPRPFEESRR